MVTPLVLTDRNQPAPTLAGRSALEALVRAAEAERRESEFLATFAHELRNQLSPVMNWVEVMKRAPSDPELMVRARGNLERQLGHLKRLVDDLLEVGRAACHRLELKRTRVDLGVVLEQALEAGRPAFAAAGQMLTVSPLPEPVMLEADPVRLSQVFANLLANACKYTDPGGRIDVVAVRQRGAVVVRISDSGIGIPPGLLERVFERFMQVDGSGQRSQGGLGIGLALARELVELHGGTITAHSEGLGRGSQFVVRLPIPASQPPRIHLLRDNAGSGGCAG